MFLTVYKRDIKELVYDVSCESNRIDEIEV